MTLALLCFLAPIVILKLLSAAFQRLTAKLDRELADSLIALNRFKARDGMEAIDWQKADRAGERTWHRTLRGQRRLRDEDARIEDYLAQPSERPDEPRRVH